MTHGTIGGVLVFPMILSLAACSTAEKTGTHTEIRRLNGSRVLLNTPDLRTVWQMPVGVGTRHGQVTPNFISCSEPSADVAKVIGDSLSISGALSAKLPQGIEPNVAAAITSATAASLAQLGERLATIQLLRDGLFRACEAYANGALSDISYAVLLSRYDDTMVTLLASELAAGAFGRSLATLSSEAGGTAKSSLDVAEKREQTRDVERQLDTKQSEKRDTERKFDEKRAELRESEKQLSAKRSELNDIDRKLTSSKLKEGNLERSIAAASTPPANPSAVASQKSELEQTQKETKKLETDRSEALKSVTKLESETHQSQKDSQQLEASLSQKEKEISRLQEEVNRKLSAEVAATSKASATAAGSITRLQDKDVANTVAEIQRKYIENINTDALVVACLVALDRDSARATTTLQTECPKFLQAVIQKQGERVDALIKASHKRYEAALGQDLEVATDTINKAAKQIEELKKGIGGK